MKLTPYISTINSASNGEARSITVSFKENRTKVHYRLNKKGITSVKTQVRENHAATTMRPPNTSDVYEKKAEQLVFLQTGKTRWLREETPSFGAQTGRLRATEENRT